MSGGGLGAGSGRRGAEARASLLGRGPAAGAPPEPSSAVPRGPDPALCAALSSQLEEPRRVHASPGSVLPKPLASLCEPSPLCHGRCTAREPENDLHSVLLGVMVAVGWGSEDILDCTARSQLIQEGG